MISFDCKTIMLEKLVFWYNYLHDFYLYKMWRIAFDWDFYFQQITSHHKIRIISDARINCKERKNFSFTFNYILLKYSESKIEYRKIQFKCFYLINQVSLSE